MADPYLVDPEQEEWLRVPGDARPLVSYLSLRTEELVRAITNEVALALLPEPKKRPEELDIEIAANYRAVIRLFIRIIDEARPPEPGELEPIRVGAGRRAAEGFALRTVFWVQHLQARHIWRAVCEMQPPLEREQLQVVGELLHRFMSHLLEAVVIGRAEGLYSEHRTAAETVTAALLEGAPSEALAANLGVTLDPTYTVVALRIGEHPHELVPDDPHPQPAGVRKARRVRARLVRLLGPNPLADIGPDGGVVLVPARQGDPWTIDGEGWVASLADAAGATVWAVGVPAVAIAALPDRARAANETLDALVAANASGGSYRLQDAAFERLLWRVASGAEEVAGVAEAIAAHPDLEQTLTAYIAHDSDRRATAAVLFVHPNTVDNRLAKIATVSGLDPRTNHGLIRLHLAFSMLRMRRPNLAD